MPSRRGASFWFRVPGWSHFENLGIQRTKHTQHSPKPASRTVELRPACLLISWILACCSLLLYTLLHNTPHVHLCLLALLLICLPVTHDARKLFLVIVLYCIYLLLLRFMLCIPFLLRFVLWTTVQLQGHWLIFLYFVKRSDKLTKSIFPQGLSCVTLISCLTPQMFVPAGSHPADREALNIISWNTMNGVPQLHIHGRCWCCAGSEATKVSWCAVHALV